ncbi:MAG TPA: HAMP domain-containing sensor histidine kinase [Acidobacteriota bacterium]|nr:HAMP domain-containing sensor histidine kinase [Acidobacteriota bacterium]
MPGLKKKESAFRLRARWFCHLAIIVISLILFATVIGSLHELRQEAGSMGLDRTEITLAFASIAMTIVLLGLGLYLLIRDYMDLRWFQLRSDFVGGVTHEFKTPLSLIRLYSETLAGNDRDFSPEERGDYLRIIARESERLSHIVENVLSFSSRERKQQSHLLREGDLAGTLEQTVENYSEYLLMKGFTLKSSLPPEFPPVRFNNEQISQALINLLDNARKYSGDSRMIRLKAWTSGSDVIVEVEDDGIGIPAGEQEKIFEPFYRVSGRSDKGGCGLGLYLVAQVMKDHGGKVEVESEKNSGSRFRLILPAVTKGKTGGILRET